MPIVAVGQILEVFSETSLLLIGRPSNKYFFLMLPELYQGKRKIILTSFFAIKKQIILILDLLLFHLGTF